MNLRRIPLLPTLVVLAAVAVMVRLGFWQLDRLVQKEALLHLYSENAQTSDLISLMNEGPIQRKAHWYRRTQLYCEARVPTSARAGRSAKGEVGWSHWADCRVYDNLPLALVNLGWSKSPEPVAFVGGQVSGVIVPDDGKQAHVVADPPLAGLEANARPDPNDMPNNHLAYAVQWFLFALTALLIYAIALRKRIKAS